MRATDIITVAQKIADEKKVIAERKEAALRQKEKLKEAFYRCNRMVDVMPLA